MYCYRLLRRRNPAMIQKSLTFTYTPTSTTTMRSAAACLFLLLVTTFLADSSNAFHLNHRQHSYNIFKSAGQPNIGNLQYQDDSHILDLQEGEMLCTTESNNSPGAGCYYDDDDDGGNNNIIAYRQIHDKRYSASDWLYNLKTWRHSTVLRDVRNPVVALGSWATFVSLVFRVFQTTGRSSWALNMSIPHAAHSFLVSSIGLLLVFRTNSAYQRFLVSHMKRMTF